MTNVHFHVLCSDDDRRAAVCNGDVFVFSSLDPARRLCALAQGTIAEAFAPYDPLG